MKPADGDDAEIMNDRWSGKMKAIKCSGRGGENGGSDGGEDG